MLGLHLCLSYYKLTVDATVCANSFSLHTTDWFRDRGRVEIHALELTTTQGLIYCYTHE